MQKEILINVEPQEKRVAVVEGGSLEEYYIERPSDVSLVGNIYKGTVNSVMSGIGAAFVDIGFGRNGFLYVTDMMAPIQEFDLLETAGQHPRHIPRPKPSDIDKLVKKGQEVLVQVVKEPIGNKGPRLTTHVGIPGRFVVLMPFDHHMGISKRVTDRNERERLRQVLKKIMPGLNMGFIVRTAGVGKSEADFKREIRYLAALWRNIKNRSTKIKAPNLVNEEYSLTFRILRDIFTEDVARVLVDDREEYKKLRHFANNIMPSMKRKLLLYQEKTPLFDSRGIEKEVEKLYNKKIALKCGGYVFIEETEGLIAIDVNSGSFNKKYMEETAFKVNSEAATEIAKQIRLRDIGGIVIIDFIDMVREKHNREIFDLLVNLFKKDRAKINVLKMSEFGIVQITRQRIRRGVKKVSYKDCPYCHGRGSVKSAATMAIEVLRAIKKQIEKVRLKEIRSYVHPEVANYMLNEDRPAIAKLEAMYRTRIVIIAEPEMHIENFRIEK
ncbi:MAG: Rne/Rng family ribonuclease [Candidatus Omnitrophota bacterium]|nr:Rne/Rng family ribonuclease [Candidatus Omnitrophota bacterium]